MAKGNIISLLDGMYQYELPPEPRDEKTILNYDKKKYDQIWTRPFIPNVNKMEAKQRIEFIEKMDDYFWNGRWMFIGGELIWITGNHWDFLVFDEFDFGHPEYLKQQRFDFYFRDLVRKDTRCYGFIALKCRRCGFTSEEISEDIYILNSDEKQHIGLQSNEGNKCVQSLLRPLIDTYISRPRWMRGKHYAPGGKKPRNALELINIKDGGEENEERKVFFLNGDVFAYKTVAAAMDGLKKKKITMDEVFKWKEASAQEALEINKKCIVEYGITGKVNMLSTMGDSDDVAVAVKEGCKLYYDSNPQVRNEYGRTGSGLYPWFVSAIHSADVPEEVRDPAYTRFGDINKDKAEAYIKAQWNVHPENSKQRVYEMRRLPLEPRHGLLAAVGKSFLPTIRMQARLDQLSMMPPRQKPYVRGFLSDPDSRGRVYFVPDEAGIWLVSIRPFVDSVKDIDTSNRWKLNDGIFSQVINPEYFGGYDPLRFKTKNTTSKNLSQACILIYKKFDYFGSGIFNEFAGLMLYRPEEPKQAHYEGMKASRFWGAPMMAERSIDDVEDVYEENGMTDFLLKDARGIWGISTSPKIIENGVQGLASFFGVPKSEDEKDQVACYPFEDGLLDYIHFDTGDTFKSHVTMATIMCMKGAEQFSYTNQTEGKTRNILRVLQELIPPR